MQHMDSKNYLKKISPSIMICNLPLVAWNICNIVNWTRWKMYPENWIPQFPASWRGLSSARERKIETSDAYVHSRLLRVLRVVAERTIHGGRHGGYNEVLLTPRCGISISSAAPYRYYSSCVAQDVLLLSSSENERVRSSRPFACIWRARFYARVTTQAIATYVHTHPTVP